MLRISETLWAAAGGAPPYEHTHGSGTPQHTRLAALSSVRSSSWHTDMSHATALSSTWLVLC